MIFNLGWVLLRFSCMIALMPASSSAALNNLLNNTRESITSRYVIFELFGKCQFVTRTSSPLQVATQGVSGELSGPPISNRNCIQLAACSATQLLPMNPELPADLFTSCLTTPIKMALRWFVMQNQGKLAPRISVEMLDKIPGKGLQLSIISIKSINM